MLKVENLDVHYGEIQALRGVNLEVGAGEIVAIIGANGAGKTTLLRTIMGLSRPTAGAVHYQDQPLIGVPTEQVVGRGLVMVPEGRRIFPLLSVLDNLHLGTFARPKQGVKEDLEEVLTLFPRLRERSQQRAGTLSGGEQQMLAIGRGMMARPKLLLLDEPSMGLAPLLVKQILTNIVEINRRGTTILLVEQNARAALKMAHRAYVLEVGQIVLTGPAATVASHPDVLRAYLGETADPAAAQ